MDRRMAQTLPLLMFAILNALSCHSEVRARDPEVEEEEAQQMPSTFGTDHLSMAHNNQHHSTSGLMSSVGTHQNSVKHLRERLHPSAHRGNWCAYVNHHVVTKAVLCTETQTVKSVNPCPHGGPDCQIIMYRLESRPMYKQKQTTHSSVHWQCCPGYEGHNCLEKEKPPEGEDHISESRQDQSEHSGTSRVNNNNDSEGKMLTDQLDDTEWEDKPHIRGPSLPVHPHHSPVGAKDGTPTSQPLPILDSSILLSMHQLMSIMMSQLQPVLESFNQTLQHLSGEVDELSRDLQQMRLEQFEERSSRTEAGNVEEKLEYSHLQISHMKTQLDKQKEQMERAFQSQEELLQRNLTKLKEEMDDQIDQSLDAQVNIQSLSVLVEEVRLGQKRLEGTLQRERAESVKPGGSQPTQETSMWEAITQLNEETQINSAQLSSLSQTSEGTASVVQALKADLLNLGQKLEEVKNDTKVNFVEIGFEIQSARMRVQNSISDLKANLSAHEGQLKEIELDLDNIFQRQRNNSPHAGQECSCESFSESLVRLEMEVADVTHLAKNNQLVLEDAGVEGKQARWMTEVEDLHQGLLHMKESLAFEQGRSRVINNNISQLKASLLDNQLEIRGLKERDASNSLEIQGLSATFSSLLSDAVRHSEVLEMLLGEEVLEFTSWSSSQQKELSIPNLLQKMHFMQQKIENHDRSLERKKHPRESEMHSDDAVAYSDWTSTKNLVGRDSELVSADPATREEDEDEDYSVSDFWSLGREVEELAGRINLLERRCGNCTETPGGSVAELQADITSLRQNMEDHLRTFEKLFSHIEALTGSGRSLNLDEVWKMVRRKERKNRRNHNQEEIKGGNQNSSSRRSKRCAETDHPLLPYSPVVFVTNLNQRPNRELTSTNVAVNQGGAFDPTSQMFHAPEAGLYLFLVTLDFQRGHSLAVLKRSGVSVVSLRQEQGGPVSRVSLLELRQGEEVTLQLIRGSLRKAQPGDNTLSGLLLFITEQKVVL